MSPAVSGPCISSMDIFALLSPKILLAFGYMSPIRLGG
jgi:hypothetical protein